jgi:hypothetical protein
MTSEYLKKIQMLFIKECKQCYSFEHKQNMTLTSLGWQELDR